MNADTTQNTGEFRWMDCDAYVFDIDGTLLNTRDLVHYNALNRAMRDVYGADTTIDGIVWHGKTDLGILRAALNRAGIDDVSFERELLRALTVVRSSVAENAAGLRPELCGCVADLLERFNLAGKLLGVASGNLESVGWHKLSAAGLRDYFAFGCFSDHCESRTDIFRNAMEEVRRRLGETAKVCFVGDTPEDIAAAHASGAAVIAVCTGIYDRDTLLRYGPEVCIGSCSELLSHGTAWGSKPETP